MFVIKESPENKDKSKNKLGHKSVVFNSDSVINFYGKEKSKN